MENGFQTLERLIASSAVKHKVLASNIANSDTPGYKAQDVEFKAVLDDEKLALKTTNNRHIELSNETTDINKMLTFKKRPSWGDGNNVEPDMEIAEMTENALFYDASAKLLSSNIRMFKEAIRSK
ncbi:MAG: flagellar basal body rod protein FlgB [Nitrospirae bacterium]|nr:flagellar basal body rod protein FlgB [Nitrospirota bacterium]